MSASAVPVWRIALPVPLPRAFDYLPAPALTPPPRGGRVRVPFGARRLVGFFLEQAEAEVDAATLRPVETVLDLETSLFDAELWQSLCWAAGYYQRPLGEVLAAALPAPLRQGEPLPDTRMPYWTLTPAGRDGHGRLRSGSRPQRLAAQLAQRDCSADDLAGIDPCQYP